MAEYAYEQLKGMTVADLRKIADGFPDNQELQGHSTMHKEQLLPPLAKALGIEVHHAATGAEKMKIKALIRKLKARRNELMAGSERKGLAAIVTQIHALKRRLHRLVPAGK